jgi:hypothetical protein
MVSYKIVLLNFGDQYQRVALVGKKTGALTL